MDSLFVALLMLFFAQGLTGRDYWAARGVALAFVAGLAAALD
jgi:hypothetical protein